MEDTVKEMKYEYMLHTWGGFYNEKYQKVHNERSGYKWFNSNEERQQEIGRLRTIEDSMGAHSLVVSVEEGHHTRLMTILSAIVEYKGQTLYMEHSAGYGYPVSAAEYMLEWKWPHNHYIGDTDTTWEDEVDAGNAKIVESWYSRIEIPYNQENYY